MSLALLNSKIESAMATCARINAILDRAETRGTRYFTDGTGVWAFPVSGRPQYRFFMEKTWGRSSFSCLAKFKEAPGNAREITQEEAMEVRK